MCTHSVCVCVYACTRGSLACMCTCGVQLCSPCRHVHVQRNVCSLRHLGNKQGTLGQGGGGGDGGSTLQARHVQLPLQEVTPSTSHQVGGKGPMRAAREGVLGAPPPLVPLSGARRGSQAPSGCG